MDRRTLLFIVALSLTLFFVNLFFEHRNTQKKQEWVAQQKTQQDVKRKERSDDVKQRTATEESLPLAHLYADPKQDVFIISGVWFNNQVLTLSWAEDLPKTVYVQDPESDELNTYNLAFSSKGLGTPVLYQLEPKKYAVIPPLPHSGNYDLQLLTFYPFNSQYPVEITLGEYEDGKIFVPEDVTKDINLSTKKEAFVAIALFKTDDSYVPVGFYDYHAKKLIPLRDVSGLDEFIKVKKEEPSAPILTSEEEKYFVLENEYMQLVFSNMGGALAEINLPFQSDKNQASVVKEIEFDRAMVENHPYNALFPAHSYYTANLNGNSEPEWHDQGKLGGYYPLLRRDLVQTGKKQSVNVPPQYYALNFVSEYPELSELMYQVTEFTPYSITFEATQNYRHITKKFFFEQGDIKGAPYVINAEIKVEGNGKGIWLSTGIPEVEWISGSPAPSFKYRITRNKKPEIEKIEEPKDVLTVSTVYPDWICNSNGFLGTILDPLTETDAGYRVQRVPGKVVPSRLVEINEEYNRFPADSMPGFVTYLPLKAKGGIMKFRLFAGPFDETILKKVDAIYTDPSNDYTPDYIACQTMHGWFTFISEPFAKFLLVLMNFFHSITGSWAFSIILLTICLRIILYPLNAWSTRSMVRMQQINPEVIAIQEKYKKDPKKAQIEVMNLYREKGINPASGCLPLLIQMPFLIGMFDLLKSSFSLRGASFIPGWIDDLTAPDVLFSWNYPIFFIGTEFHLLPVLLGAVMLIQQKFFSTGPTDPKMMTDQQRQQRAMGTMMSVVFAVMFYHFPSGLNIYWLSSMILGILQQWYTTIQLQKKHEAIIPVTGHPVVASKKREK